MSSKIDRLAELQIDRSDVNEAPKRWPWIVAGLIVVAALGVYAFNAFNNRAIPVVAEAVQVARTAGGVGSVLDASGYVVARRQATVSSEISGKVLEVLIEEGMTVEKDQVVAYLDDSLQKAYLELAQAELESAKANQKEIQAQLSQAQLELKRIEELAAKNLASDAELDSARANAETLSARLDAGDQRVTVAQRNVDVSRDQLDNTIIRAPFAGVVVSKNAQPGEMISPNSAGGGFTRTGICTIVDMESLEIEVDVNEAYIQRVRQGQEVVATLDAYQDWKIPADVIAIVPTADRQKATVRVRIGFRERDPRILRDMGVKVAFLEERESSGEQQQAAATLYISSDALRSDADGNFVWLLRDDTAVRRPIEIGQRTNRGVPVLGGLGPGDKVILSAERELSTGVSVSQQ